ncbi:MULTISPECIES: LytTR family DNA-binding domain-containing protein [Pedobacter]|uniref:LytR/AlgR family response regulator transcription factor n=1 Tax=Pedobacter TaxID=84567 RepID=UPI002930AEF8|nr:MULTISPECIES: LytTR family DNA-binding domain-containing protein [Pedobacter]
MKKIIPCIIVDDEHGAIRTIGDYIGRMPRLELTNTYTDPLEALAEMSQQKIPHLIYSDIDMPSFTGINLAESLRDSPHHIIFTTSYPDYAVNAFGLRVKNYLLKPFDLPEFAKGTEAVLKEFFSPITLEEETDDSFFLRTDPEKTTLTRVLKDDITYIQGANNNVYIYTQENYYSVYMTFTEIEQKLADSINFYRIQRSYIINSGHVKAISGNMVNAGKYNVLMSPNYNAKFLDWVNRIWLKTKRK